MRAINNQENQQITWVGIDVAKKSYDAAIYLPLGKNDKPRDVIELPKNSFERTEKSIEDFRYWAYQVRDKAGAPGGQMRIVMEATGRYSQELTDWLRKEMPFTKPVIMNPKIVSDYRKSLYTGNDTDSIAAAALARFGAERQPEEVPENPPEYQHLRELTRQRLNMVEHRTATYLRLEEIKDIKVIAKIQQTLINTLNKSIEKLDFEIKKCVEKSDELRENVAYATSIKGIGLLTAASVFAECGQLINYSSRQLGAYSGLAPFNHRSGTSISYTHISRKGPKQLRRALYTPMTCLLQYNPEMAKFRQRLIDKGKTPMQARCAIMRKILILMRALVVNKTYYQENYKKI